MRVFRPKLVGNVTVQTRKNKDRSRVYYLVWRLTQEWGGVRRMCKPLRILRTGPRPKQKELREHYRNAVAMAIQEQEEIQGKGRMRSMALDLAICRYMGFIEGADGYSNRKRAVSTIERQYRVLWDFINYVADNWPDIRKVNQISARHINGGGVTEDGETCPMGWRWIRKNSVCDNTLRTELSDIGAWLRWCHRQGWSSGLISFSRPVNPRKRPMVPDIKHIRQAWRGQPTRERRRAVILLAATGMRQGELRMLRPKSWDGEQNVLTVPTTKRKRNNQRDERKMPLCGMGIDVLARQLRAMNGEEYLFTDVHGEPLKCHINRWLKPFDLKPHDLRRWFTTQLEEMECPSYFIDDLLGHVPSGVREAYSQGIPFSKAQYWLREVEAVLAGH